MKDYRVIEVKQSVFASNDRKADELRKSLDDKGVFLINVMSSPGAGKTTLLSKLIPLLSEAHSVGVMEADIDSDVDAAAIEQKTGARVIQLHTGGMCHLDAGMTEQGLEALDVSGLDLVILENVGNLVCPAEFDTGSHLNLVILSVPEGHDKPLKYPLMFEVGHLLVINKTDVLDFFDFDMDKVVEFAHKRNPNLKVLPVCAKTGEGIDILAHEIERIVNERRNLHA